VSCPSSPFVKTLGILTLAADCPVQVGFPIVQVGAIGGELVLEPASELVVWDGGGQAELAS